MHPAPSLSGAEHCLAAQTPDNTSDLSRSIFKRQFAMLQLAAVLWRCKGPQNEFATSGAGEGHAVPATGRSNNALRALLSAHYPALQSLCLSQEVALMKQLQAGVSRGANRSTSEIHPSFRRRTSGPRPVAPQPTVCQRDIACNVASVPRMTTNGHMNGSATAPALQGVFPEAHTTLKSADPEMYELIQEEKKRQW